MTRTNEHSVTVTEFDATARRREKMRARSRENVPESKPPVIVPPSQPEPPTDLRNILAAFVKEHAATSIGNVDFDTDIEGEYGVDWFQTGFLFDTLEERYGIDLAEEREDADLLTLNRIMERVQAKIETEKPVATLPKEAPPQPLQKDDSVAKSSPLDRKELETFLLDFVAEQTGYPLDMIQWDSDLEGDLGIGSLKMATLFGGLSDYFEVRLDPNLSVADFPTLRHVLDYLLENATPIASSEIAAVSVTVDAADSPLDTAKLETFLIQFVVDQTGYPEDMVSLDADLEGDLGIDSLKKATLFADLNEHFDVRVDEGLSLADFPTLRHVMYYLRENAQPLNDSLREDAFPTETATEMVTETKTVTETSNFIDREELRQFLVQFIVEQTGFPDEMVHTEAHLQSDLGIGSLKIATLLSELTEHYDIPFDSSVSADDFQTLGDVLDYIVQHGKRKQ